MSENNVASLLKGRSRKRLARPEVDERRKAVVLEKSTMLSFN